MTSQLDSMYVAIYWLCTWENLKIRFLTRKVWIRLQSNANDFWGSMVYVSWLGGRRVATLSSDLNNIYPSCWLWIQDVLKEISKFDFGKATHTRSSIRFINLHWAFSMLFEMGIKITFSSWETELAKDPIIFSPSKARIWIKIFRPWEILSKFLLNYSCFFKVK